MTTPLSLLELADLLNDLSEDSNLFEEGEASATAELLRAAYEVIMAVEHIVTLRIRYNPSTMWTDAERDLIEAHNNYSALRNGKP